jgi:hypothetical protein
MTDASVAMTGGLGVPGEGSPATAGAQVDGGGSRDAVWANEQVEEPAREQPLSAVAVAEAWLAELADQVSVSASQVQDRLLDLWGYLDDGPTRVEVERWLTETLRRNLYSVSDINDRLESLLPIA